MRKWILCIAALLVVLTQAEARGCRGGGRRGGGCSSGSCGSYSYSMGYSYSWSSGGCSSSSCGQPPRVTLPPMVQPIIVEEPLTRREIRQEKRALRRAIDMVNARRARVGMPAFVEVEELSKAAQAAAEYRAKYGIQGHTSNDFSFLGGASAAAAGCAAWDWGTVNQLGWGSCCSDESWRYAGAGYAVGQDGLVYMHLFVR